MTLALLCALAGRQSRCCYVGRWRRAPNLRSRRARVGGATILKGVRIPLRFKEDFCLKARLSRLSFETFSSSTILCRSSREAGTSQMRSNRDSRRCEGTIANNGSGSRVVQQSGDCFLIAIAQIPPRGGNAEKVAEKERPPASGLRHCLRQSSGTSTDHRLDKTFRYSCSGR